MSDTFGDRVQAIEDEAVAFAVRYIASRPVGSWISKSMFEHAMAGFRVDFRRLSEVLAEQHNRAAWFVMAPNGGGFFGIIVGDETVVRGLAQMPKPR